MNITITTDWIFIKIETETQVAKPKPKMLQIKTTSNGRQPQNIINWISQKQLICFSLNFKLKIRGSNQNKRGLKLRQPPMEDDLNILKVECLSNHWLDLPQILTEAQVTKPKQKLLEMKTISHGRRPQNILIWISQKRLIGFSANFKL